ncbi:MAG: pyruvate ferredoxin oxidoreductase, partial [Nitrososphaerota archaeon]
LDRAVSHGAISAPLGLDIKALLYEYDIKIPVMNFVYGLGGRDISPKDIATIFNRAEKIAKKKSIPHGYEYIGVREK